MASLKILYIYYKILGICSYNLPRNGRVRLSYSGAMYQIILGMICIVSYLRIATNNIIFVLPRQTPITQIAHYSGLSIEFGTVMSALLYFGLRPQRLQRILVRLKNINESFKMHGIYSDDERFFREMKIHVTVVNAFWYLFSAYCCALTYYTEPSKLTIWMPIYFPRIINHNIVLIFVDVMKSFGQRFRLLNEKILSLPNEGSTRITIRHKSTKNIAKKCGLEWPVTPSSLEACGQIYSDLIDLTTIVAQYFSLSILLTILFQCIQITSSIYTICTLIMDKTLSRWAFAWIVWFAIHFSEMVTIVSVCDSTVNEANQTGSVLHTMIITGRMDKYVDSAEVLSFRLLQERLKIEVFGLFPIKLAIFHKIVSTITAYVIIMMQLDSQNNPV